MLLGPTFAFGGGLGLNFGFAAADVTDPLMIVEALSPGIDAELAKLAQLFAARPDASSGRPRRHQVAHWLLIVD